MSKQFQTPHTGVLLVNLGTPDSPSVADVRKYLREFLMDKRVVDVPWLLRFILVNGIIAPFRAPKSAKVYKEVWEERGSPLKFYSEDITEMLQQNLGEEYVVKLGMRYQNPSLKAALEDLKSFKRIIVIPLFPQYASATSGSVMDKVMEITMQWQIIPEVQMVHNFYQHPLFIQTFATLGKKYLEQGSYDHVLFSYHGLPERQIRKGDDTNTCLVAARKDKSLAAKPNCCAHIHPGNKSCYRAQCFATSRMLAEALGLKEEDYTVCFQSRLGNDPWIQPYTEGLIKKMAHEGKKKLLAFSPAFVADCLETTIEIGDEYNEVFEEAGGEHIQLVESLNNHPDWVRLLEDLVRQMGTPLPEPENKVEALSGN